MSTYIYYSDVFYIPLGTARYAPTYPGVKAKPYSPQSKGGVEVFNRFVNAFLAKASAQKIKTLEELNQFWDIWLDEYYHNKPHEGIEEYYKSLHSPVPPGGISPLQEWNRDSHPLPLY